MVSLVKKNSAFFIPYFIFLFAGGIVLIFLSKTNIALFINGYHSPVADSFFAWYTLIGLGWLIIPVALALSFVRLRYVIMALVAYLLAFVINDTIKVIAGAPRPAEVFAHIHQPLYFVPGVAIYHWNSFPSGHSAISFCLFSLLALVSENKVLKFTFFVLAFLVAYSRMYLSEHFLIDVYIGSLIGVASTVFSYRIGFGMKWLNKFPIMDKPVINLQKISPGNNK